MNFKSKVNSLYKNNKETVYIILLAVIGFVSIFVYKYCFKSKTTYTITNGYVEKTTDTIAYIVKDEAVLDISNNATIPVIEQGKRVAKGETIAIYKNDKYDAYLKKVEELDKEIKNMIKDLPTVYSSDINAIDASIQELVKELKKETSYIKMQEYKVKIDELSYKKVSLLGQLSPTGSKIRELIDKRNEFEKTNENSSDNIVATRSGVVSYKIDNLENVVTTNNLLKCNISELNNLIEKYKNGYESNYGIKIIDNFDAYLVLKEKRGENDPYIKSGRRYNIKLTDKDSELVSATLVKLLQDDEYNYCIFEISNSIEHLADVRTLGIEVVWTRVSGMAVPRAIIRDIKDEIGYVSVLRGGEYIDVPVKIRLSNGELDIVENLSNEEKERYGVTEEIKIYDQLLYKDARV